MISFPFLKKGRERKKAATRESKQVSLSRHLSGESSHLFALNLTVTLPLSLFLNRFNSFISLVSSPSLVTVQFLYDGCGKFFAVEELEFLIDSRVLFGIGDSVRCFYLS